MQRRKIAGKLQKVSPETGIVFAAASKEHAAAFRSPRPDGGYGLGSMEHTAKKYDGNATFRYDETNKTFTTRIRLNLHPEKL